MSLTKIIVTGAGEAMKTAWQKVNTFIDDYEAGTNAAAHNTKHQNGGADEISVTGLSGLLADDQHVLDAEVLAAAGINSGITSMTGLDDGGIPVAKVDGAAASGANADITSMTGLDDDGIPLAKVADAMKDDGSNLAIGSDADGDTYYRASGALARLAKGTANFKKFMNAAGTAPEWAAGVKVGTFTRDLTAASGDVSYSGVGFKPSAIIFLANKTSNPEASWGFSTGAVNYTTYYRGTGIIGNNSNACIMLTPDATNIQHALVKTLDAHGFTLTWTKVNSPTGTGTIFYLAFR
jgi:hypothetical protein